MSGIGLAAAMIGAAAWALPWLTSLLGAETPLFWHQAHAIAGLSWTIALLIHATQWRHAGGVMALRIAALAAAAFAVTNTGEALTGNEVFVRPYGIAMLAMSIAAAVAGAQGLRDPHLPRRVALARMTLAAFPAALLFGLAGLTVGTVALVAYGTAWLWFGAIGRLDRSRLST